jgi:hypothetical protein
MRMSEPRNGRRSLWAGIAVAATAAAVTAGTAVPAWAAATGTIDVTTGPIGGGVAVTLTTTGDALDFATAKARFATSCAGTFGTTSSSNPEATVALDATTKDDATATVPALAAGTYKMCVYAGTTVAGTTALTASSSNNLVLAGLTTPLTLAPAVGPVAGTTTTATGVGPYLASATTPAVTLRTSTCPTTYSATSATVATVTKPSGGANAIASITVPAGLTSGTAYKVCVYAGTGTSALLGNGTYSVLPSATISPAAGNSGGGNTITMSVPINTVNGASPAATFTTGTCPTAYATGSSAEPYVSGTVTKISSAKVAIPVPSDVVVLNSAATTAWNVCLYGSSSGNLIAVPPVYTVAPTLGVATPTLDITGGPAQGQTLVTFSNMTGIPEAAGATLTATLGGNQITGISVIDNTSFSGYTPAHGAGAVSLSVTTAAGTQTSNSTVFTYSYGITTTPTQAAPGATPTMDVMGAGFSALASNFADYPTVTATKSHVLLVDNAWYAAHPTDVNALTTAAPTTQCKGVTVISDNELICTLDLANTLTITTGAVSAGNVPTGVYQIAVVNTANAMATGNFSIISSGSTFTVSTY